ncbi:MAG: SxtJ family membrane protein [Pirellulaceae bacterium]
MLTINRQATPRDLFWFGLLTPAAMVLVGLMLAWRLNSATVGVSVTAAAALSALVYWSAPPLRRPMYLGWRMLTFPLAWLSTYGVLAVVYYLLLTPLAAVMRLAGRDALRLRRRQDASSYWSQRQGDRPAADYYRQF